MSPRTSRSGHGSGPDDLLCGPRTHGVRRRVPSRFGAEDGRAQPFRRTRDGDRALCVGTEHSGAARPQRCQGARGGMAVGVVPAAADEGQPGPQPAQQPRILVAGAVVGDLQHVDGRQSGGARERLLRGRFEIAGQQHGQSRRTHEQGDAGVVGSLCRPSRQRPQHPPGDRPQAPLPRRGAEHPDPGFVGGPPDELGLVRRLVERRRLDGTDRASPEHTRQTGHVIGVEVCQHHERHPGDPQSAQTAVHRLRFGAGVDDYGRAVTRRDHQGIPLADVADREPPAGRRPPREEPWQRRGPEHGEQQRQRTGSGEPGAAEQPRDQEHQCRCDDDEEQRALPASRPVQFGTGQCRAGPGHPRDPLDGPAGEPREPLRGRHRPGCDGQSGEAEHRGGGDGQFGEQVARHGDQADPGRQHHDHRRARSLCRGRGGQHLREPGRHPAPAQCLAPARGDRQERGRGQDGQQEAVGPGEPGVVEDEQQHRGGQRGQQRPPPPGGDGQQRDRTAGGSPQDARLRPAHDDKAENERPREEGCAAQRDPEPGRDAPPLGTDGQMRRADQQGQHDREVGSGHRQQVSEVRAAEGRVQVVGHPGGVPHHQAGEQGPGVR